VLLWTETLVRGLGAGSGFWERGHARRSQGDLGQSTDKLVVHGFSERHRQGDVSSGAPPRPVHSLDPVSYVHFDHHRNSLPRVVFSGPSLQHYRGRSASPVLVVLVALIMLVVFDRV
jgi:hypothetical protein